MTEEIRADLAALRHQIAAINTKADIAVRVLLHLLTGQSDMAIHDDILAALTSNDAALVAVGAKVDTLIADYSAGTAAFNDVLPRVTAQGSAIAALDAKVAGVMPAVEAAGAVAAPAAPAAAASAAPVDAAQPAPAAPVVTLTPTAPTA